jgi:hypothetical protein
MASGSRQSAEQPIALSVGTAAAALGRYDEAEELFAEAIGLSQRACAPTYIAWTQVAWADALVTRDESGDVERARGLAEQALTTAEELGLGRVAELSRQILSR